MSRIASVKVKKALTACKQAVSSRVLAFCVMVVCLVATLSVTAANLRLTYVTDSNGARQVQDLRGQNAGGWALYRYGSLFGAGAPEQAAAECAALRALTGKEG